MLFTSWEFAGLLLLTFAAYHVMPWRAQNMLLLCVSYVFYGWWDFRFLGLLLLSTAVDYTVARRLQSHDCKHRRFLLAVSVTTNLTILGVFKYYNFFADSLVAGVAPFGIQLHLSTLNIVLPIGLSFYTFQSMAYTIDVYRGHFSAIRNPLLFGLYISYFPQLVAGPIERAQRLIPQLTRPRSVTADQLSSGALLILIGLVRKVAIADRAAPFVDAAFSNPGGVGSVELIVAVFLFAIQIYCDFAGYSDIARGTSKLFGVELAQNFAHPYFATNITNFWRCWHMSLSSWLRDYLYVPLGGNRGKPLATHRNVVVTMMLGGLWHGAAWTFVVWGTLHGLALTAHRIVFRTGSRSRSLIAAVPRKWLWAFAAWCATFGFVGMTWVLFRAPDLSTALDFLMNIAYWRQSHDLSSLLMLSGLTIILLSIDLPQYIAQSDVTILRMPWVVRGLAYAILVLILVMMRPSDGAPFIYFQF